jgi:signal transduction histidine kinase
MVTLCGWLVELSLIFLVGGRMSVLGWYAGRLYGLLASTCVLAVLLSETASLYARLARAALEERHQRQAQLMTMDVLSASIAHEMNQPLTSVVTNADAALRWLIRPAPDLDEVSASLERIRRSANHAGDVIRSIRALVKKDQRNRETVAINDLIRETIVLVQDAIQRHRISVTLDLTEVLPSTNSDRTQLQQVLINLVSNAIDAIALESRSRRLRIRSALQPPDVIAVSVEDNGPGIAPEVADRIFNPLVTTKSHGMGMGLAICRAIIEAHEGRLSTSPAAGGGTVFQFVLPSSAATEPASRA